MGEIIILFFFEYKQNNVTRVFLPSASLNDLAPSQVSILRTVRWLWDMFVIVPVSHCFYFFSCCFFFLRGPIPLKKKREGDVGKKEKKKNEYHQHLNRLQYFARISVPTHAAFEVLLLFFSKVIDNQPCSPFVRFYYFCISFP